MELTSKASKQLFVYLSTHILYLLLLLVITCSLRFEFQDGYLPGLILEAFNFTIFLQSQKNIACHHSHFSSLLAWDILLGEMPAPH